MNGRDILRAIGEIKDPYIEMAAPLQGKGRQRKRHLPAAGWAAAACLLIVLAAGVLYRTGGVGHHGTNQQGEQIANPFITCNTLAEAEKTAGFSLKAPDTAAGSTGQTIQAVRKELIQIFYLDPSGKTILMIRKAAGTDDVSGDYNTYSKVSEVKQDGVTVSLRGNGDTVSLAVWTKDGYAYAMEAQEHPLSQKEMLALADQIR